MANLLLVTLRRPPPRGSLQESVLARLIIKKEENEVAKARALVQAIVNHDAGSEAWESYFQAAFPWVEVAKKREKSEWAGKLKEEINRGPLVITAQHQPSFRSRLKTKVVQRDERDVDLSRLAKKMNPTIPVRRESGPK